MSRAPLLRSGVLAALSALCTGGGACVLLAPFPDVAPDPSGEVGGGPAAVEGCEPGARRSCDSLPGATREDGDCTAGFATCNEEGTAYGPCVGAVEPAFESCSTEADENCDGHGCTGAYEHGVTFGGAGEQRGAAVAVGLDAVAMVGSVSGALDLGAEPTDELGGVGDPDCFLAFFRGV